MGLKRDDTPANLVPPTGDDRTPNVNRPQKYVKELNADLERRLVAAARSNSANNLPPEEFEREYIFCSLSPASIDGTEPAAPAGMPALLAPERRGEVEVQADLSRLVHLLSPPDLRAAELSVACDGKKFLRGKHGCAHVTTGNLTAKADFVIRSSKFILADAQVPHGRGGGATPHWSTVQFVAELTTSKEKFLDKRKQWLRYAYYVFAHQPARARLFGLIQHAGQLVWCYADHAVVVFSAPFQPRPRFYAAFSELLGSPDLLFGHGRGGSPGQADNQEPSPCYEDVGYEIGGDGDILVHATLGGHRLVETAVVEYRPVVIGRHLRVSLVVIAGRSNIIKLAFECAWSGEEKYVLDKLVDAGVEGLPRPGPINLIGPSTRALPSKCDPGFPRKREDDEGVDDEHFSTAFGDSQQPGGGHLAPPEIARSAFAEAGSASAHTRAEASRRRLVALSMSPCIPMHDWALSNTDPRELMLHILSGMQCYWSAYSRAGVVQGDVSPGNLLRAGPDSEFTGGAKPLATLCDFNLAYVLGKKSGRSARSGTPLFMSRKLLERNFDGRTIEHDILDDLESWFYVVVYFATAADEYRPSDRCSWRNTPLHEIFQQRPSSTMAKVRDYSFHSDRAFKDYILAYMKPTFNRDARFRSAMLAWRRLLFPADDASSLDESLAGLDLDVPAKRAEKMERAWEDCMDTIRDYCGETQSLGPQLGA